MPNVIIALLLVTFAIISWREFKLALTLIIALLPAYLIRFELVIPWTLLEGFILIAFIIWLSRRPNLKLTRSVLAQYQAPVFGLLMIATLAIFWSPDKMSALGIWKAYFVEPGLMFMMLRTTFTSRSDWMRALTGLGLTVIGLSAFAIFQTLTGLGVPIPWDIERRATSVFEYPNALGLFIAPIITALSVVRPRIAWLTIPLGLIAIWFAQTEAALVAMPVAFIIVLLISHVPIKIKITTLCGSLLLGAMLMASMPSVASKLMLRDYSGNVRRAQWAETIELLQDRPLLGAGLAGYPLVLNEYHDPRLYEIFQYPHNVILNFWVEMGIFGVLVFLWFAITVGKLAWQRRDDPIVLAAFVALLTMAIHGLVDVPFLKNDLAVLTAFFLAMMLLPKRNREPINHPDVRKD